MTSETSVNLINSDQSENRFKNKTGSLILYILIHLSSFVTILILGILLFFMLIRGIPYISPKLFEFNYTKENVSMMPAIINTLIITIITLVIAIPVGVGAAIYLVEYANQENKFLGFIRLTTETLSGIPSIIYGLFGFLMFAISFHWGYSLLGGALTLAIMILPVIIRTTEEALKSVPDTYREASFGLGAGKLRTIFSVILPTALPGILSGIILSIGRIVGETAALIYTSGTTAKVPSSIMGSGRTLAVHMYTLLSEGLYMDQAYATGVVLIIIVLLINLSSEFIVKILSGTQDE